MKKLFISAVVAALFFAACVHSHGAPQYPPSRQIRLGSVFGGGWNCAGFSQPSQQLDGKICRALMAKGANTNQVSTMWKSIGIGSAAGKFGNPGVNTAEDALKKHQSAVGNGRICGGGMKQYDAVTDTLWQDPKYAIKLDPSRKWEYHATAPHVTYPNGYFYHYITKDNWDSSLPITWDSLELVPFCKYTPSHPNTAVQKRQYVNERGEHFVGLYECQVPENKKGYHVIYNIWQRSDSDEAFYGCSDVILGEGPGGNGGEAGSGIGGQEDKWVNVVNSNGDIELRAHVAIGDTAELRVNGKVFTVQVDDANVDNGWKGQLANSVNSAFSEFKFGLENAEGIIEVSETEIIQAYELASSLKEFKWSVHVIAGEGNGPDDDPEDPTNGGDDNGPDDNEPVDGGDDNGPDDNEPVDGGDDNGAIKPDVDPVDGGEPNNGGCVDKEQHPAWVAAGVLCKDLKATDTWCLYKEVKDECCACGGGNK